MSDPTPHATCVSLDGLGVLLRGPSGSGKSDLALRLIDTGTARLVGDDYCDLAVEDGRVVARPRPTGAGVLEVRGLGLLRLDVACLSDGAPVVAVLDLIPGPVPERLPDDDWTEVLGVAVRRFVLDPFTASATAKVRLAARLASGTLQALS